MQLFEARIQNFRSLRDVAVTFDAHTAFIGGNGAGKSSILKALEKFYSTSKSLEPDDYFGRDTSLTVEIELTFGHLTEEEHDTFENRIRDDKLTVTRVFDNSSASGRYFGSVPQNPDFSPIRMLASARERNNAYRNLRTTNDAYADLPAAASAPQAEEFLKQWEADHPEALVLERDDGQFFGFQNAGRGALQRHTSFVFVPAVREAAADASDGKSSAIGKLLEIVVRSAILQRRDVLAFQQEVTEKYRALVAPDNMPELGELASRLTGDIKSLYRDAEVGLAWREVTDIPVPLPVADVSLSDDGFGGPVDRQGHGLQRAFVFTLLQHLAKNSMPAALTAEGAADGDAEVRPVNAPNLILAIEEPELYQHPTKQRHLASVLRGLSAGSLPGAEGPTQILFGSHSPMFVSLEKAHEIRLVRRAVCEDSDFKQCELRSLDLDTVANRLGLAWGKEGAFTAATLIPRLHILGNELAEGFFANGIVLVEGRSDKAALYACARLLGLDFEAAGIAVLSAEGKGNLDKPYAIFTELGIPTFMLWDCDRGKKEAHANLPLLRLANPGQQIDIAPVETRVARNFAHFEDTLETLLISEIGNDLHQACLGDACEPFGLTANKDTHKVPEVMHQTLRHAKARGAACRTIEGLVRSIWLYLTNEQINADDSEAQPA